MIPVFVVIVCLMATMCKKDSAISIVSNWSLINDSINSNFGGATHDSNYKGLNSDYFNFSTDGKLYIREGNLYDTSNYQVLSGNKIIIDSISATDNGEYVPSTISVLTPTKATIIVTNAVLNPGGGYERIINLSR